MEKLELLLTVVGSDRPGIVGDVAREIDRVEGNVEQSRSARLGGEFAGFFLVRLARERESALRSGLESLGGRGLTVQVKATSAGERRQGLIPCQLTVAGADHEGIIHEIGSLLSAKGINIAEMTTDVHPSPVSATPMFSMQAVIEVPREQDLKELRRFLEEVGDREIVDISLKITPQ